MGENFRDYTLENVMIKGFRLEASRASTLEPGGFERLEIYLKTSKDKTYAVIISRDSGDLSDCREKRLRRSKRYEPWDMVVN